ncbi:serine/threonine-protein kinase [Streptomyces sp. NPDC003247]|uniref:serine/threonine-protein kinase n=1 Tax=Streptomyces sp. NPDC003247 TaxID=3364677 RepID=UPI0036A5B95C
MAGRYRLNDVLGRGGMGVVWRAHDELIGRSVAVKELRLPQGVPAQERTLFGERALREARTTGRLNHPAVVSVYDLVPAPEGDDAVYIVMELVDAPSLAEVLERHGPLAEERVAGMAGQLLAALEAAHAIGLVHRDVKPGNIMVLPGDKVKLVDFGIAHAMDDTRLTRHGIAGSTGYMAPELFEGADPSPAADLWSLGATLFHATEGHDPFTRPTPAATLHAVLRGDLPPLNSHPPLSTLITGLLTRDPTDRLTGRQALALLRPATNRPAVELPTRASITPSTTDWQHHPTAVNPTAGPPYRVVPPRSARAFHRWYLGAALATTALLIWGVVLSFAEDTYGFLYFLAPFPLIGALSRYIRPVHHGWVDVTSERISLSRHNPAPRDAPFFKWDHIEKVTVSSAAQSVQEEVHAFSTTVTLHIAADMPANVKHAPYLVDRIHGKPFAWTLWTVIAPAEAVEAAFRSAAPPSVRVGRGTDPSGRGHRYPGPFLITGLLAALIATAWATVMLLLATLGS